MGGLAQYKIENMTDDFHTWKTISTLYHFTKFHYNSHAKQVIILHISLVLYI